MYLLNKHIHPSNFRFADSLSSRFSIGESTYRLMTHSFDDVYQISISAENRSDKKRVQPPLNALDRVCGGEVHHNTQLAATSTGEFILTDRGGREVLRSCSGMGFGISGSQWMCTFVREQETQFFGLGEKQTFFERSGRSYKFWNLDCWADHGHDTVAHHFYDPDYISIPYLIIKRQNEYVGILMDTPYCSVVSIDQKDVIAAQMEVHEQHPQSMLYLGAEDGPPSLYIIYGPSLAELTRKFQKLVGTLPLPPLWALGYHQSRWGYRSDKDLLWLAENFQKHKHPVDGLWLDIEYMDGYRVFTFDKGSIPDPAQTIEAIHRQGYHIVPILDPGVKKDEGYRIYREGREADIFCKNRAGTDFTGLVWPGQTVFPDFSTEEGRAVWGRWVEEFARTGFHAAWIDMNDPSTGRIQCTDMLFEKGSKPHETYHNLYGSLMARATREGFEAVWPDQRVFLLSRSGFTGAQQYAAHWTGDNFSNYFHLRHCIGKSINLALSGMPFNGPDVGGFGGDATPGLMIDWIKACFLFPFFRNHCAQNRVRQEPWMLGEEVLEISRTFTRLRYKLLPYLYNLFVNQEKTGEAILRPLMYDFDDTTQVALGTVDTQHMVGPSIMQAPFVEEGASKREIVLPQALWYRADWGRWIEGNGVIETPKDLSTTPIFIRDGAIIPMQQGIRTSNRNDLHTIELLLCISPDFSGTARYTYAADDGISFAYYNGKRSVYTIEVTREGLSLHLLIHQESDNAGGVRFTPVTVHKFEKLVVESESGKKQKKRKKHSNVYFGAELTWFWWEQDGNTIKTEQVLTTALE